MAFAPEPRPKLQASQLRSSCFLFLLDMTSAAHHSEIDQSLYPFVGCLSIQSHTHPCRPCLTPTKNRPFSKKEPPPVSATGSNPKPPHVDPPAHRGHHQLGVRASEERHCASVRIVGGERSQGAGPGEARRTEWAHRVGAWLRKGETTSHKDLTRFDR